MVSSQADEPHFKRTMKFKVNKRNEESTDLNEIEREEVPVDDVVTPAEEETVELGEEVMDLNYKKYDSEEQCGCVCLFQSPKWLQKLATRRTFLFVFCLSSVMQGMFFTYFVSCLTTIEKLFQIRTQTIGMIMSTTEIGQIGGGLLLAYFAGNGHRPRWIAGGIVLFSFSVLLCSVPHFLFGDAALNNFLASAPTHENPEATANICKNVNSTNFDNSVEACSDLTDNSKVVLTLFFMALLGVGLGQTALFNIGIPYLDDNIANEDSPTYFGTTIGVRIFGPTLGFVLGSFCTRLSIDPFSEPKFQPTDPRWIGAWWLGLVLISLGLLLVSFLMMMFPKQLPKKGQVAESLYSSVPKLSRSSKCRYESLQREFTEDVPSTIVAVPCEMASSYRDSYGKIVKYRESECNCYGEKKTFHREVEKKSLADFIQVLSRLLRNRVLVLRTASSVLHILPLSGLYTFLPKYLETQFRLAVHSAAMISGVGGISVMGLGIFMSGFVIRKLNPSPRSVTAWIAIATFLYAVGMVILMFLGCSSNNIIQKPDMTSSIFEPMCNRTCDSCDETNFAPICSSEGHTYFSACHAGCSKIRVQENSSDIWFEDCQCLGEGVTADLRFCDIECPNLVWYVAIFCFFVIIHSTSEVGGMLVTLRCVKPEDKVMALGFISVAIGIFGNVPCPILYGSVIDTACIHSRESCGVRGACEIYDPELFGTYFHGLTAALMFAAFVLDVAIWYYSKEISFSDESHTEGSKILQSVSEGKLKTFSIDEEMHFMPLSDTNTCNNHVLNDKDSQNTSENVADRNINEESRRPSTASCSSTRDPQHL